MMLCNVACRPCETLCHARCISEHRSECTMTLSRRIRWILGRMGFGRRRIEYEVTCLAAPVVDHVMKILKWDDPQYFFYDRHDVDMWIYEIPTPRLSGLRLKSDDIFKWLVQEYIPDPQRCKMIIHGKLDRYHHLPVVRSDEEVFQETYRILRQAVDDFVAHKFFSIEDYL